MQKNVEDFLDDLFLQPEFDKVRYDSYEEEDDEYYEPRLNKIESIKFIVKKDKDVTGWERILARTKPDEYRIISPREYKKFKKFQKEEEEEDDYYNSQFDEYDEDGEITDDAFERMLNQTDDIFYNSERLERKSNKSRMSKKEKKFMKYFKKYEKKEKRKPKKLNAMELFNSISDEELLEWYASKGFRMKNKKYSGSKNVNTIVTDKAKRGELLDELKAELMANLREDPMERELESFIGDDDYDSKSKSFKSMKMKKKGKNLSKDVISKFII